MYDYIDFYHDFSLHFLSIIDMDFKEKKIINLKKGKDTKIQMFLPNWNMSNNVNTSTYLKSRVDHLQRDLSQSLEFTCV